MICVATCVDALARHDFTHVGQVASSQLPFITGKQEAAKRKLCDPARVLSSSSPSFSRRPAQSGAGQRGDEQHQGVVPDRPFTEHPHANRGKMAQQSRTPRPGHSAKTTRRAPCAPGDGSQSARRAADNQRHDARLDEPGEEQRQHEFVLERRVILKLDDTPTCCLHRCADRVSSRHCQL